MTHKEFYIWLEGYLYGKLENKHIEITPIVEKMQLVKDEPKIGIAEPYRISMPTNPFNPIPNIPRTVDPIWNPTIICETKINKND